MAGAPTADGPVVTALYRYPIKSCGGMALAQAEVGPRGIVGDREFMVVEQASGLFLTQREQPRLAQVRPDVTAATLTLSAPDVQPVSAPIVRDGAVRPVVVWRDRCSAVDQGDEVALWLSDLLGVACRLVRMADDHVRPVDPDYATKVTDQVGFADGYPFLLISEESLDDLNGRLSEPLPMNRFRPNIVVRGAGVAYAEDGWRCIRIGDVAFYLVKPCARCVTTTTDQETAARGKEPLVTLATYRRSERGVLFGQNLIHSDEGMLRCGERVTVLA